MSKMEIIKKSGIATDMSEEEVALIVELATDESYSSEDVIIREDDTNRDLFLIYEGWVYIEARRGVAELDSIKLGVLRTRGIAGEVSFIDGSRRTASAVAKEDVRCLRFPYEKLKDLMEKNQQIGFLIMRNLAMVLCERIRNLNFEFRNHLVW